MNTAAIRKQLRLLGIAPHMVGFAYIEQAIALWTPGCMITKEIYPIIAKANGKDIRAVEKSVRDAIKFAWVFNRGNTGAIFEVFGLWAITQRPKASELIAAVAMWAESTTKGEDEDED